MSEEIIKNQIFEYDGSNPFHIYSIYGTEQVDETLLLNHWHTELEVAYVFKGSSTHYIDGNCIKANAEKLIVVNSESVHNIIPDPSCYGTLGVIAVVLVISRSYMEELIPDFENIYFVIPERNGREELWDLMHKISDYGIMEAEREKEKDAYEKLASDFYIKGLVHLILSYLCKYGARQRNLIMPINYQKNIERLRGVLSFIQRHYSKQISQAEVAKKFYFSAGYFSRFFKKNTGFTFVDYLTRYRLQQAIKDILYTRKSILEIALENGFSDSRSFINAFKKQYDITPFQYRKTKLK